MGGDLSHGRRLSRREGGRMKPKTDHQLINTPVLGPASELCALSVEERERLVVLLAARCADMSRTGDRNYPIARARYQRVEDSLTLGGRA